MTALAPASGGGWPGDASAPPLLDWLRGRWRVTRAINGEAGAFVGHAQFSGQGRESLRWHESGRLTLGGYSGHATRTLAVVRAADGAHEVRFDDGRHFHRLDLREGRTEVVHLCGPDRYAGVYEVIDRGRLAVSWRVTGPGRDDEIVSRYRRV